MNLVPNLGSFDVDYVRFDVAMAVAAKLYGSKSVSDIEGCMGANYLISTPGAPSKIRSI
jgi:hypothetical protein